MTFKLLKEKGLRLRFVVGDINGPWSGTWIAWANQGKGDLYVAARSTAGDLKVSLHQSGECRLALTSEHVGRAGAIAGAKDRRSLVWQLTENVGAAGMSRPLAIHIGPTELDARVAPPKKAPVVFIPAAPEGRVTEIGVVFTTPDVTTSSWPGANNRTRLIGVFELVSGSKVWFISQEVELPAAYLMHLATIRNSMNNVPIPQNVTTKTEPSVYRAILASEVQNATVFLTELLLDSHDRIRPSPC